MQESDGTTSLPAAPVPCVASERPSHASPPCKAVYGLSARQQREGLLLLLLLRITFRPIPSVDAYEAPAGTVPYPSTVHRAVGPLRSCILRGGLGMRRACLTPRSVCLVVWRWTREAS